MSSEGTVSNMKDCFKDHWETVANTTDPEMFSDHGLLFPRSASDWRVWHLKNVPFCFADRPNVVQLYFPLC